MKTNLKNFCLGATAPSGPGPPLSGSF